LQNPTKRFRTVSAQAKVANEVIRRIEPFGGRRRGALQAYPIENAIMNAVALLQDEIDAAGAEVRLPKGSHNVALDGTDLQEVLLNLLNNSLYWLKQVGRESRVISLDVERYEDGSLAITVEDSGPGVPVGDREFIFDPYFTTKEDGVGLGLQVHFALSFVAFLVVFGSAVVIERNVRKMGRLGIEKVSDSIAKRSRPSNPDSFGDRMRRRFRNDPS